MKDLEHLTCVFEETQYKLLYGWDIIPIGHRVPGGPTEDWFYWRYFKSPEAAKEYGDNLPNYMTKNKPYVIRKMY